MKFAIVLPAGSGKTYLSNKYEKLIDIDSLLTKDQQNILNNLCQKAIKDNNWETHIKQEYEFINNKILDFDDKYILLLHHETKAQKYNLEVIGSFKTNEEKMLEVAKERSKISSFWSECTKHNYYSCENSVILDNHNQIEEKILKIINYNINNE